MSARYQPDILETYVVSWVGHGIEGSDGSRKFIQDIVIGIVFLLDQSSKELLGLGAKPNPNQRVCACIQIE